MDTTEIRLTQSGLDEIAAGILKYCTRLEDADNDLSGHVTELGAAPDELEHLAGDLRKRIVRLSNDITRLEMEGSAPCAAPLDNGEDRKQITADGRVYDYLKHLLIISNELEDQVRLHEADDIFSPTCANMDGIRQTISQLRCKLVQFAFEYRPALGGHFSSVNAAERKEVNSHTDA